jgi:hypothetical protein
MIPSKFEPLERYLRDLPIDKQEVSIAFEQIERILGEPLPPPALDDSLWWGNQKKGTSVETIPWMDAGWMVDTVDLSEKRVKFVRQ